MNADQVPTTTVNSAPVLTVSALNQAVAHLLERNFPLSWVSGEISNFTRAASGHWYFTLKDDTAQVRAVMFKGRAQFAGFVPREGDRVEVRALVTLYAARGEYQLSVEAIRRAGLGNLYEAFLRLKEKLNAEGLFNSDRKRPIPAFVRRVGIITSPQAAALRDILTTLQRRAPQLQLILYPTPVQGSGAREKICRAIDTASARAECDVLLLCRGGGSIEDLWSFNEESVARAIAACSIPVICGVGHETDITIADFAADLRAPTPTAAAELVTRPQRDWLALLQSYASDLGTALRRQLTERAQSVDWYARRLQSPTSYINQERLKLRNLQTSLHYNAHGSLNRASFAVTQLRTRLQAQLPDLRRPRLTLENQSRRLADRYRNRLQRQRQQLGTLTAQLEMLNPQRTLERGYAIISNAHGQPLRSVQELHPRSILTVQLARGSAEVGIASVQPALE